MLKKNCQAFVLSSIVVLAAILLCGSCSSLGKTKELFHGLSKLREDVEYLVKNSGKHYYDHYYHYEYEYGDLLVRRNDGLERVVLELLQSGEVVDRVKIPIDPDAYNCLWRLYFDTSSSSVIVAAVADHDCKSRFRFRRCLGIKDWSRNLWGEKGNRFILDFLRPSVFWSFQELSDRLGYLSELEKEGRFHDMDIMVPMDTSATSYIQTGYDSVSVKMRVYDKEGQLLYSKSNE